MSRLNKRELLGVVIESVLESGWNVLSLNAEHPFEIQIYRDSDSHRVRLYIWNLTHGGGAARARDEYRIQVTSLPTRRFEAKPGAKTLILGWWQGAGVFAGFDFRRHSGFLGSSPSIQIQEEPLRRAHRNGFYAHHKGNEEIAVAFRPDFFGEYVKNLESLHDFGESEQDLEILDQVAEDPQGVNDSEIGMVSGARQTTVTSVRRKLRDNSFRARVLTAYSHRCAACGLQLDLVDAAHILPVAHPDSTDSTSNGIALCALHHRAYDRALMMVDEEYRVVVSELHMARLTEIGHDEGANDFIRQLRPLILLPPAIPDRPNTRYLQLANDLRSSTGA